MWRKEMSLLFKKFDFSTNEKLEAKHVMRGLLVLLIILFVIYGWLEQDKIKVATVLRDICYALFTTLIIAFVVNIYNEINSRDKMTKAIFNAMSCSPHLLNNYDKKGVLGILKNSFSSLVGRNLSEKYIDGIVEKQLENFSYRSNQIYEVSIRRKDHGSYIIEQQLEYTKHIKDVSAEPLMVSCLFTFKKDPTRHTFDKNIVFFREELTNENLISKLKRLKNNKHEILEELNFKWYVLTKDDLISIDDENITVKFMDDDGIILNTIIDGEYIFQDKNNYKCFFLRMECSYPTNKKDYFHCTFPEPTEGVTFHIEFDKNWMEMENVNNMMFVSNPNYKLNKIVDRNRFKFEYDNDNKDNNMIFPNAGLVFHWR